MQYVLYSDQSVNNEVNKQEYSMYSTITLSLNSGHGD